MAIETTFDCVVVGAGPAGLTAAIYLARFRRKVLVIDAGGSRAVWIPKSHNYPGFPEGIGGKALLARMRRQAEQYGTRIVSGNVSELKVVKTAFRLKTAEGTLAARKVILATGVIDNEPAVPGFEAAVRVVQDRPAASPICASARASPGSSTRFTRVSGSRRAPAWRLTPARSWTQRGGLWSARIRRRRWPVSMRRVTWCAA